MRGEHAAIGISFASISCAFLRLLPSIFLAVLSGCFAANALAASTPEIDRILRDSTRPAPQLPPPVPSPAIKAPEQPKPEVPAEVSEVRIKVTRFVFHGNEVISEQVLRAAVADSENKSLNFGELMSVVEKVEAVYKNAGYFLAQAYLPPQQIKDGAIEITVSEGRLGQTRLEGESRIKPEVVYALLDQLPKGRAVKLVEVERQVLLINDLAGSSATLDMQASEEAGYTDVVIAQKVESRVSGRVELNNHGMPATGAQHVGLFLNVNSPLGRGDKFGGNVMRSNTGNLDSYGLSYELPFGAHGWRLTAGTSLSQYKIATGAAAALNVTGNVHAYRGGVSYPLIRSRNTNLNLKLELAHNLMSSENNAAGADQNTSNVLNASAGGDWMDQWLGGGANHAELAFTGGRLKLGATALAGDNNTQGGYGKALFTLQREQNLRANLTLQAQLTHQRAGKNLDGSEKFSIGGPTTLPGYANGEASGDDGTLLRLKLNWRVRGDTALGLFADYAHIRAAHHAVAASDCNVDPNITSNHCHFSDAGLMLDWQGTQGITASAIMAWAYRAKPNPDDNDRPRIWANVGYNW